jgi:hypothetical protein
MVKAEELTQEDKENITPVLVEAVLMPNGEIIRNGKTIQWIKTDFKGVYKLVD